MTTQTTGVTQQSTVSESEIRQENAAVAAIENGFSGDNQQPGASDNIDNITPHLPPLPDPTQGDKIRSAQAQEAQDREDFMANIAAKRRQFQNDGNTEPTDWEDENVDNTVETQQNQVQGQETPVEQAAQQPQEVAQPVQDDQPRFFTDEASGQQMVQLKVNGQLTVVPAQRLYAAAQKMEAGDERLRQAAQERERLNADRLAFEQQRSQQIPQPSTDADPDLKEKIREGLRQLQDGDESAVDALVDTLTKGRASTTPQIDTRQIAHEVTLEQNRNAWSNNLNVDAAAFDADPAFKDVTGNPVLLQRAQQLAGAYVQQNQSWNTGERPRDIMNRMAEQVRSEARAMAEAAGYVLPQQQQQVTPQPSRSQVVEQRKVQAGNTAVGGGEQRQVTTQRPVAQDGGRSPTSADAKLAAFAELTAMRDNPAIKR